MSFGGPLLLAPLASLLGIRPGMNVSVLNAPAGFLEALLPLPEGAALVDTSKTGLDVQVLFTAKKTELIEKLTQLTRGMAVHGALWICFPPASDNQQAPTEDFVRYAALEMGLEDTRKVLLDPAWVGLKLQWRPRAPRAEKPQLQA
ncbi:MAG: DUF3052 family protein [Myxococcales bacterium]|nr:DUF3052 family protein [Myxococcales bacterium]